MNRDELDPVDLGPDDAKARFEANLARLNSGDPVRISEVARQLMLRERYSDLSEGEAEMLGQARAILIAELRSSGSLED